MRFSSAFRRRPSPPKVLTGQSLLKYSVIDALGRNIARWRTESGSERRQQCLRHFCRQRPSLSRPWLCLEHHPRELSPSCRWSIRPLHPTRPTISLLPPRRRHEDLHRRLRSPGLRIRLRHPCHAGRGENLLGESWVRTPAGSGSEATQGNGLLTFGDISSGNFATFSQSFATIKGDTYLLSFRFANSLDGSSFPNDPSELLVTTDAGSPALSPFLSCPLGQWRFSALWDWVLSDIVKVGRLNRGPGRREIGACQFYPVWLELGATREPDIPLLLIARA